MADKNVGMEYSIGHTRYKYLDLANMSFAGGNYVQCKAYIENFLDTIDENKESGKELKKEFDRIYVNRENIQRGIEKKISGMGFLEKKDYEDNAKAELEINTIHDLKAVCWRIGMKDGLFYE